MDLRNSRRSMRKDTVIGVWIGLALGSVGAFVLRDTLWTVGRVFFVLRVALALSLFALGLGITVRASDARRLKIQMSRLERHRPPGS